jgi:hypothetical protein
MRNYQLVNWYVGNERVMPNGDQTVLGLPCRFPATPSILAEFRAQLFDRTQFFDVGRAQKKFFP